MRICLLVLFCAVLTSVWCQTSTVTSLLIDDDQNVYLGSENGLSRMDANTRQMTRILDGVSVSAMAFNKRHGVYIGCNGNEIWTPDGNKFAQLEDPEAKITCMMVFNGLIWVGTKDGIYTISINRKEIANHFTAGNSELASNTINTMFVDGSGIKWVGTDRGVVRIEGDKKWKCYEPSTRFLAITGNSEGAWLAGDKEMWLVDPFNRWTPTDVKDGLSSGTIRSVATDRQGRIYVLSDIFVQFDPYSDVILPVEEQSTSAIARNVALAIDNDDHLWVASEEEGIRMIDPETSVASGPLMATLLVKHPSCTDSRDGSIEVSVQGGQPPYQYYWNHDKLLNDRKASDLSPGDYEVIVTDAAGNDYSDDASLFQPDKMKASVGEDATAEGYALEVVASGGRGDFRYDWNTGSTTRKISIESAGTYTVTVTDANACSITASYAVNESALTQASPIAEEVVPEEEAPLEAVTVENLKALNVEKLNVGQVLRIEQLQFQADSSDIQEGSYAVLDGISAFLEQNGAIIIEIGGHTNGLPDDEYCDRLSTARAKSVAEYIISKGIPSNRVVFHGYGKRQPIATNQTIEGRRKNQRVEVKILQM